MLPFDVVVGLAVASLAGVLVGVAVHPGVPRYVYELPGRLIRRAGRLVRRWAR